MSCSSNIIILGLQVLSITIFHYPHPVFSSSSHVSEALEDLVRSQLALTRSLVDRSRSLAQYLTDSITPDYHYTTLEDTKEVVIIIIIPASREIGCLVFDCSAKMYVLRQTLYSHRECMFILILVRWLYIKC